MPVVSSNTMKAFQLNIAKVVAITCCISIGIIEVSGTPQKHIASDGRKYLIETEYKYNWFEAFNECIRRDSQLLTIDSEEKNTVIINLLKEVIGESRNLWLGGNDAFSVDKGRPFYWSATGQKFTFTYWSKGEPTDGGSTEHCVHIWQPTQYQWNDIICTAKLGFICESNPYLETYKKELKPACDALNKFNDDIFIKFEHLQKANIDQSNMRLQSFEQKLIDQQELTAKNLWEKLQKQGNKLNEQIAQSMLQIHANFDEKFNASIPSPQPFKNVVFIKQ